MFSPYTGKIYSNQEVLEAAGKYHGQIQVIKHVNKYKNAAKSIAEGKIIGWFQGRSEVGPRSLGNRSLLADPRNPQMKDIINYRVKFREAFRPFAPSVLYEYQQEYFDLDIPSPYMLMVADIWPEKREQIPSVTHIDGTGRLQTVVKGMNPVYYELIHHFYKLTGVPVLLNTSFNVNGEPIVETPDDAIKCFLHSDFDELYVEDVLVTKIKN